MASPPAIDTAPIARGGLSATPRLLTTAQVAALRSDAESLYRAGCFVPGGLRRPSAEGDAHITGPRSGGGGSKRWRSSDNNMQTTTDATTRICDICGLFDDAERAPEGVGNREAREELFDLMADLRELLQHELGVQLSEGMELQYLRYPGIGDEGRGENGEICKERSGFYRRHFDSAHDDPSTRRRKVSLLLYLNEGEWDAGKDGGVLRAYVKPNAGEIHNGKAEKCESRLCSQDVIPEGGKLVLFDSKSVEHEVLPTRRERWAVVGWFLGEERAQRASVGGKRLSSGASRGDEGRGRKRRKKKRRRDGK